MRMAIAQWLNDSSLSAWVVDTWFFWPTLETLHFIGLCIFMSGLLVVDFRLLGVYTNLSLKSAQTCIRICLFGFAINLTTGICFLAGNTWKYAQGNLAFDLKLVLIVILGVNALFFKLKLEALFDTEKVTFASQLVGGISLLLWCLVIVCGRMITFFATNN
ncbi:MAG: hypothetical protein KTR16_04580 [Acidiferrobacterales bacterium]|nr:hypothetical protein [Acidiferrobacterales bacterium]